MSRPLITWMSRRQWAEEEIRGNWWLDAELVRHEYYTYAWFVVAGLEVSVVW